MGANSSRWETLVQSRSNAFFSGGIMFVISAALSVVAIVTGNERFSLHLGEAFIAATWIGVLVGLLGLYPAVVERRPWLARAGAAFAAIGLVAFGVLLVVSVYTFATDANIEDLPVMYILPGIFSGSLLAFVTISAASLRNERLSRTVSLLLVVPALVFVTNFLVLPMFLCPGPNPPEVGFVLTSALALAMLAIGYVLRTDSSRAGRSAAVDDTPTR